MANFCKENRCVMCPKAFCCRTCRFKHEKTVHKRPSKGDLNSAKPKLSFENRKIYPANVYSNLSDNRTLPDIPEALKYEVNNAKTPLQENVNVKNLIALYNNTTDLHEDKAENDSMLLRNGKNSQLSKGLLATSTPHQTKFEKCQDYFDGISPGCETASPRMSTSEIVVNLDSTEGSNIRIDEDESKNKFTEDSKICKRVTFHGQPFVTVTIDTSEDDRENSAESEESINHSSLEDSENTSDKKVVEMTSSVTPRGSTDENESSSDRVSVTSTVDEISSVTQRSNSTHESGSPSDIESIPTTVEEASSLTQKSNSTPDEVQDLIKAEAEVRDLVDSTLWQSAYSCSSEIANSTETLDEIIVNDESDRTKSWAIDTSINQTTYAESLEVTRAEGVEFSFADQDLRFLPSSTFNLSHSVWKNITKSIKSALNSTKELCSLGGSTMKRSLDVVVTSEPKAKRRKCETNVKCRPPIHDMGAIVCVRLDSRFVIRFDKATQTEESSFTRNSSLAVSMISEP